MVKVAREIRPAAIRRHVLHMAMRGNSVHIGCAFSLAEILSTLFSRYLRINLADPMDQDRDYVILSKGHGVMGLYACHRELGWIGQDALDRYFSDGSDLPGLCESKNLGMETTTGSMGHGLPVAAGIAMGLKRLGRTGQRVFCIAGDGEMNEGSMWEALIFIGHHRLDNVVLIVDANGFQAMGRSDEIASLEPLPQKLESFGFATRECDGHDLAALEKSLDQLLQIKGPKALVARTVKGKGVSFMEHNNEWHYRRLNPELLAKSLAEIGASE